MVMTIYTADHAVGDPTNTLYPKECVVTDTASLADAVAHDYVGPEFAGNRRKTDNFCRADCTLMDCDNDHTDDPDKWITPDDVERAFPGVAFGIHYSKNHNKEKGGKTARPRFHVIFPITPTTDVDVYAAIKRRTYRIFPYFDANALDAARMMAGTANPQVEWHDGIFTLSEFLDSEPDDAADTAKPATTAAQAAPSPATAPAATPTGVIPQGQRNATLSLFAGRVLKRCGDTPEARQAFDDRAGDCTPPLSSAEITTIWQSAQRFYATHITTQPGYVPPSQYNGAPTGKASYRPDDMTDVGQAKVLSRNYASQMCYTNAMGYLVYSDGRWRADETRARALAQDLTDQQIREALDIVRDEAAKSKPKKEVISGAYKFRDYALSRRSSMRISACLKEAKSMMATPLESFDADPYLFNTTEGTYDLRQGLAGLREHSPNDHLTHMTAIPPNTVGADIWHHFLETIFCGDADLIHYVQCEMGQMLIGRVCEEAMIIAYGSGRNGKSTFFNAISRILGSYAGKISPAVLTTGTQRPNVMQELAAARGKRLLVASEMTEGARLDDGTLKQLCSTDPVLARMLYKEPFVYTPSHVLVLYTNHLPKVSSLDSGTWRRLTVVPFHATIDGSSDIKNYSDFLFDHAGGAILSWLIEGAKMAIDLDFRIDKPKAVLEAVEAYRDQNDWLRHFLEDCCVCDGDGSEASSLALYQAYRNYSIDNSEYVRRQSDFFAAVESAGYKRKTVKRRKYFTGLRLRTETDGDGCNDDNQMQDKAIGLNSTIVPIRRDDEFADFLA